MRNAGAITHNGPVTDTATVPETPQRTRKLGLGVLLGLVASAAFATSGPSARALFEAGWTPGAAVFWRALLAGLVMLPIGLWSMRGRLSALVAEWRHILAFGGLAVATPQLMYFAAVERMDVSIALLIEYMAPVLLVGLAWLRTRRVPAPVVLAGVAAAVAGLACVLNPGGAVPDPLGVLFALGATVGACFYFVLSARPTALTPVALAAFGLLAGSGVLGIAILVRVLPYAASLTPVTVLGASAPWWAPLAVMVLVATALAYACGIAGNALMGARLGSFVSLSEVLFAAVLAALVLAEIPTPVQVGGGVLIVAGVVLVRLDAR